MKMLYTKMTRERAPQFQQKTTIYEKNGEKFVIKSPLCEEANAHIKNMADNYSFFKERGKNHLCPITLENENVHFSFLQGVSFCNELLTLAKQKNRDGFLKNLLEYKQMVKELSFETENFHLTEEFIEVFGAIDFVGKIAAHKLNIDLIFENIIDVSGTDFIIDYEWIFDFLIPYEFVYFRAINSFYIKYAKVLEGFVEKESVFDVFGIDAEHRIKYEEMDKNFLSYVYGKQLNYDIMIRNYKKNCIEVKKETISRNIKTQMYFDLGQGFSEENSITRVLGLVDPQYHLCSITYDITPGTKNLRFDPVEGCAIIDNLKMEFAEGTALNYNVDSLSTNATFDMNGRYLFLHEDPQFIVSVPEGVKTVTITYEVFNLKKSEDDKYTEFLSDVVQQNKALNKTSSIYLEIIHSLQARLLNKHDAGEGQ